MKVLGTAHRINKPVPIVGIKAYKLGKELFRQKL